MKKSIKARKYTSAVTDELLRTITPLEMEQSKVKMQLAARIEDYMYEKGWNKSRFAEVLGKNPSEITKWFSGTQNFTLDVLTEITLALGIEFTDLFKNKPVQVVYRKEINVKSVTKQTTMMLSTPLKDTVDVFEVNFLVSGSSILPVTSIHQA